MPLQVQSFLRENGGSLELLASTHGIYATQSQKHPQLYSLKYHMIEAKPYAQITRECRGIILDSGNDWAVVARPFDRFFNLGEGPAVDIDWASTRVYEKLDGSLMILYHYDGEWQVASSGVPDASGPVMDRHTISSIYPTFAHLFWGAFKHEGYSLPDGFEEYCFMFEMMTPFNKVIVPHKTYRLTLLGVRHKDGTELLPEEVAAKCGFFTAPTFPHLTSPEEILSTISELNPMVSEGYVACDSNFQRVKVKSPAYVALSKLKDSFASPNAAIEIARLGETSEVGLYFPEYAKELERAKNRVNRLIDSLNETYESVKDIESQKEFAQNVISSPLPACLFSLRKGATPSVAEYIRTCRLASLVDALNKMNAEE